MAEWTGEMTLGDGSVVKGATMEEAFQNLAKMKVDTANAYKTEKDARSASEAKNVAYEQTIESLTKQNRSVSSPAGDGKFNKDEFYALLNSDPDAANRYWFKSTFGRDVDEFNTEYQNIGRTVSNLEQQTMAATFSAQHAEDFPHTPEAAKALRERVESLQSNGVPFNLETMNYAYGQLVNEGKIKPIEKQDDPAPNPNLRGSGGTVEPDIAKAEAMSDKELKALIAKHGMFK